MPAKPGITCICILAMLCAGSALAQTASGQASTADNASPKASSDPFIGKWKLNPSRSKLSDEMKVTSVGENKYAFDFGAGNPETIVADGTDQPGMFGTTLAISADSSNTWKVVRKQNGHIIISAKWELSQDGNTLTDHFGNVRPDGTMSTTDYVYKRSAGTAGFPGTWESTLQQSPFELQIQLYEGDGLSFIIPVQQMTTNVKFDGKDYPGVGPNLPAGFTSSGSRMNERTLELTDKVGGKRVDTRQTELSPDLKTLTITLQNESQSKPKVFVFERE